MELLSAVEARVLASLYEKKTTTPDYYPLTLNSLLAACNQKSNRDPVLELVEQEVLDALDHLWRRGLVRHVEGAGQRARKYDQLLRQGYELGEREAALISELLLRGAQTPGELRGRASRMFSMASTAEVEELLLGLSQREELLVQRMERQPGQKEARWRQTLTEEAATNLRSAEDAPEEQAPSDQADLLSRVEALEAEVRQLRDTLEEFRAQFE